MFQMVHWVQESRERRGTAPLWTKLLGSRNVWTCVTVHTIQSLLILSKVIYHLEQIYSLATGVNSFTILSSPITDIVNEMNK